MLLFTTEQELAVNAARESFNETQTALAARLGVNNGSALVGNAAPIPLDAWRRIDARAALIQRDVLAVYNRLAQASTTPTGVADLLSFYPQVSDSGAVTFSLDGRLSSKGDQADVKYVGTPTPVIHADPAVFGWRQWEMIRRGGGVIDTTTVGNNQRKVIEGMEDMAINGKPSVVVDGATIYGLRTFPQRNTNTHGLTLGSSTGAQWLSAFRALINALIGDNAYGRITVFVNYGDHSYADSNDYTANYPKTILSRLLELQQIAEIVPCSKVPANEIIGVANLGTGEWGTILSAMPPTTRPKARHNPEDDYVFDTLAMTAPQFRADYDGRSQIAHLTAS